MFTKGFEKTAQTPIPGSGMDKLFKGMRSAFGRPVKTTAPPVPPPPPKPPAAPAPGRIG